MNTAGPNAVNPLAATTPLDLNELRVYICPHHFAFSEYRGSRANLEAEGLIPDWIEWPAGDRFCYWESGPFQFCLHRKRPDGMKGPKRLWVEGDYWNVRWELKEKPPIWRTRIDRLKSELVDAIYRETPIGRVERDMAFDRYWQTRTDVQFQAFKARIPALTRSRRGRKCNPRGSGLES